MTQARLPVTTLLGTSMFFSGVTYAATLPYASLVGVDTLGMAPGFFATVMSIGAIVGTFVSLGLGYLSDHLPDRRLLVLLTAAAGVVAHGLIYLFPSQTSFAIAMALIMPLAGACYGQSFGYLRVYFVSHRPGRADFMVTSLRALFTLAWIAVPPIAGWVAAEFSIFNVYLISAVSYAAMSGIYAVLMTDPTTAVQAPAPVRAKGTSILSVFELRPGILAGLAGLVVMVGAQRLMALSVSLFIVTDLGGGVTNVGFYAGITAAVEAPCMMLMAWLTTRLSKETLLVSAGLVMALFMALISILTDLTVFYWLLLLNGLGTAALMSVNIPYIQDAIKGRVGLSTALMDVTAIGANLVGAAGFGVLASGGNYRLTLGVAAALSVLGAAIMALGNLGRLGRTRPVAA